MIRLLAKFLAVLNSETEPGQLSLGFCLAMVAGLTPFLSLHNLLVLLCVLLLRVNLSAFLLALPLFTGVAYLLDPLFHRVGLAVLAAAPLQGLWTALYNSTLWRLERFNNTIVMGSLVCSLVAFVPALLFFNALIRKYREHVMAWVARTRLMQVLKASKFYQLYQTYAGFGGGS